ncbi:MAG: ubiquitin-like protein [archaeon]|nr:ubiquitin-like protein [archaeon]
MAADPSQTRKREAAPPLSDQEPLKRLRGTSGGAIIVVGDEGEEEDAVRVVDPFAGDGQLSSATEVELKAQRKAARKAARREAKRAVKKNGKVKRVKSSSSVAASAPAAPAAPRPSTMELLANDRCGTKVKISCAPDATIATVKQLISAKIGRAASKIRLQKASIVFQDSVTLLDYDISPGTCLELYYN